MSAVPKTKIEFNVDELLRRDEEQLRRETEGWARGLCGYSTVESIERHLHKYRWNLVDFELTVTYGSRRQAELVLGGAIPGLPAFGICGTTANQLAYLFLGRQKGDILVRQINSLVTKTRSYTEGSQYGLSTYSPCEETTDGIGVEQLRQALRRLTHCLVLVHAGDNHRFVLERRPEGTITILQSWIYGYSLSHWLAPSNRPKVVHPLDSFLETLEAACGRGDGRKPHNVAIFHPVGISGLDHLSEGASVRFAAMAIEPRSIDSRVEHFFSNSRLDSAQFAP
jgi:hypothetical protein